MTALASRTTDTALQDLSILLGELRARRLALALAFAAIALAALGVGLLWPKHYRSSTTILVQEDNILQPLMEGRAVATGVVDRARIAREVVFSRKVLTELLRLGGYLEGKPSALEQERLAEDLKADTVIKSPGNNLIDFSYTDSVPERALTIARGLGELFVAESLAAKERESREAFEFIAARVDEYQLKLTQAEQRLKQYRAENMEARPGSEADVTARITEVRGRIEQARTALSELQMRERTLLDQLSGEEETSGGQGRSTQTRSRIAELQAQLDQLLLSYTDEYPDVVRTRHQIDDLRAEFAADELRRNTAAAVAGAAGADLAAANPLYRELRSGLAATRSDIAVLRARISENEAILEGELDRGRRIADSEASLAELTRDYEVNRDVYQDLLRRRENARVSMSLDAEHRGLSFRIQEPAALPLQPYGLRLLHFAIAGILLGLVVPVGLLLMLVRLDPRVRSKEKLARELPVPVLVGVSRFHSSAQRRRHRLGSAMAAAVVVAVLAAYATTAWIKFGGVG